MAEKTPRHPTPACAPAWHQQGADPDYRFSLANERTFLAWIRTALALLAGGLLLDQFATKLSPPLAAVLLATAFCGSATVFCGIAYARWRGNEIAMRHARRLPASAAMAWLAGCLMTIAGIVTVLIARG